jgi:2-polyprenyl-6-hydroxyphenyl methylase/3-demethylubiquinone-9 3-methyltransferase
MNQPAQSNVDSAELRKFGDLAARWWDRQGPFEPLHRINPLRVGYIAERVALDDACVLDVGCGGGLVAEALAERGARVLGIDLAEANIEAAKAHASQSGSSAEYRLADVEQVAAESPERFDLVLCLEMLEHVPDPERSVAACARALRPGGTVVFSTINRNAKSFVLAIVGAEYVLGMLPKGTHEYRKLIRPSELARACRGAGLELRELTGLHFNPLLRRYTLGGNVHVNYLARAIKPETA